jgi:hypothetical protein
VRAPRRGGLKVEVRARERGLLGRALGARGYTFAHDVPDNLPLQGIAFTRRGGKARHVPLRAACGRWVDWYRLHG